MAAIDPALQRHPGRSVAPGVMDMVWKIHSRPHWSATLRSDPWIVVTADGGDKLAEVATKLTIALLQGNLKQPRDPELIRQVRGLPEHGGASPDVAA